MRGSTIATAAAMAALLASAAAAQSSTTLAAYTQSSAVSVYGGVVAWSACDPKSKRFSLTVREGVRTAQIDGKVRTVPVRLLRVSDLADRADRPRELPGQRPSLRGPLG